MSRFLVLRSLYAYCKAFSTRSRATLMQFLPLPLKPFARLKTCVVQCVSEHDRHLYSWRSQVTCCVQSLQILQHLVLVHAQQPACALSRLRSDATELGLDCLFLCLSSNVRSPNDQGEPADITWLLSAMTPLWAEPAQSSQEVHSCNLEATGPVALRVRCDTRTAGAQDKLTSLTCAH